MRGGRGERAGSGEQVLAAALGFSGLTACFLVIFVVLFLVLEAAPVLTRIGPWRLLSDGSWHPSSGAFGLSPMLATSAAAAILATALAAPLGLAAALFLRLAARRPSGRLFRRLVEVSAGIPSVVFGFYGLTVVVPAIARVAPPGPSLAAGVVILALMVLPTITLAAEAGMAAVPAEWIRGAHALGLGPLAVQLRVVLPAARGAVAAGLFLGAARALGETMAVYMVMGNVVRWPADPLAPARTLTANIALEMSFATGTHRAALFAGALLLLAGVFALAQAGRFFERRGKDAG